MNTFFSDREDEAADLESAFAQKFSTNSRYQKNFSSTPFGAKPTQAPKIFDKKSTRRTVATGGEAEILMPSKRRSSQVSKVRYSKNSKSTTRSTKESKSFWARLGWVIIGLLSLRLVFMDRGVIDYFRMQNRLSSMTSEHQFYQTENISLRQEIKKIRYDSSYQRSLAKEHLGVIAADEFLILFAQDAKDSSTSTGRQY